MKAGKKSFARSSRLEDEGGDDSDSSGEADESEEDRAWCLTLCRQQVRAPVHGTGLRAGPRG